MTRSDGGDGYEAGTDDWGTHWGLRSGSGHDKWCERKGVAQSIASRLPGGMTKAEFEYILDEAFVLGLACNCDMRNTKIRAETPKAELRKKTERWILARREAGDELAQFKKRDRDRARVSMHNPHDRGKVLIREVLESGDHGRVIEVDFSKRRRSADDRD